ncbi:MAG: YiaA/YiaB family inner membrane protein [Bacteroidota bacterium]
MNSYIYENQNSKSFYNMAWIAFAISFIGMAVGIWHLEGDLSIKGFLLMSYLFSVTACFTVAKVVRDKHESEKFLNKMEKSKTEKFLAENV